MAGPRRIGEVVASATTHCTAQALREVADGLNMPKAPSFGSFVRAHLEDEGLDIFGVVYHAETTSVDATHRPLALNLNRQELREQQPQIFELLRTDFSLVITGFREEGVMRPYLPPCPPRIHDFIYACTDDEVLALTQRLDFLRTLITFAQAPVEELAAACVRTAARARPKEARPAFLADAGRSLATLLRNDYDRLGAVLSRIS